MARPGSDEPAAHHARSLRRHLTVSEARLWAHLKGGARGIRFRRQVPIGSWIAGFASLRPRIVIEVDDPSHDWRDETGRTRFLTALGFGVTRFSNAAVALELDSVITTIDSHIADLRSEAT